MSARKPTVSELATAHDVMATVRRPGDTNYQRNIAVSQTSAGVNQRTLWQRELSDAEIAEGNWDAYLAAAGWAVVSQWQNDAGHDRGILTAIVAAR